MGCDNGTLTRVLIATCTLLAVACAVLLVIVLSPTSSSTDTKCSDDDGTISFVSNTTEPLVSASSVNTDKPDVGSGGGGAPWERQYRLPSDVVPLHYNIYMDPDLDTGLFRGNVEILVQCRDRSRNALWLHAHLLTVTKSEVYKGAKSDNDKIPVQSAFNYTKNEMWVIELDREIRPDHYTVYLEFNGNLTGDIIGFYMSQYAVSAGSQEKRKIVSTKFEPTYARRAFPCFDEPAFKANYTVTLVRPAEGYLALSNMNEESTSNVEASPGRVAVKFATSVPMSTYLVCFIVCDFSYVQKLTQHQKPFRVYADGNQITRAEHALNWGVNISNFYENYFQLNYPLPKQDMIAIPDFVSGAMENWGIITFRETNLLADDKESSSGNLQSVATVVAHELAHMWFGNLMTLSWWDDLWLNEGFAAYMEYKGVGHVQPDWDMDAQFLVQDLHVVLQLDSQLSSHPIVQTVNHPDEISEVFDAITYNKGASVIRMLEDFIGKDNFRKGIYRFLEKFAYENAVTQDLWNELSKHAATNLNVTAIMSTWTQQMGYPVINVDVNESNYVLTQQRFVDGPNATDTTQTSPFNFKWDVPMSYLLSNEIGKKGALKRTWLLRDTPSVKIVKPPTAHWLKLNVNQTGYYRVNYNPENWEALKSALMSANEQFSTSDRANLVDDAFSLAKAGLLNYSLPLSLAQYLKQEKHYVPWKAAIGNFLDVDPYLWNTSLYTGFKKYVVEQVQDIYLSKGWDESNDTDHLSKMMRRDVINMACKMGIEDCLEQAAALFNDWIGNSEKYIAPNLRKLVYEYGMTRAGDEKTWDIMWERYKSETNAQEKVKLLQGLAWTQEPRLIKRFIDYAKDTDNIKTQDFFSALRNIVTNPVGAPLVWDFYRNEWQYLIDRFTLNHRYLGSFIRIVTYKFNTQRQLQEMEAFFALYPEAGAGKRARQQALENVRTNINWVSTNTPFIERWLEEHNYM